MSEQLVAASPHSACGKANATALHSSEHMVMMHRVHSAEPEERDVDSLCYIMRRLRHARRQWCMLGGWSAWEETRARLRLKETRDEIAQKAVAMALQRVALATYLLDGSCSGQVSLWRR